MDRTVALARLRVMAAADQRPVLSTEDLDTILTAYSTVDADGRLVTDAGWVGTYDLNGAAGEAWRAKAARVAGDFTFSADGASYSKGEVMANCLQMAAEYAGKSLGVVTLGTERSATIYDSPRLLL